MQTGISKSRPAGDAKSLATLRVDVIADLVCPWCYIGKRRLDRALGAVYGPAAVTWYPYQLNPDMPEDGMSLDDYLNSRFGNPSAIEPALEELRKAGKVEGINFDFSRIRRVPNTLPAHKLMYLAQSKGADPNALAETLMSRFFEQGRDISDPEVLVSAGQLHGLSPSDVRQVLDDDAATQIVLSQEKQMRGSGVAGVPAFLVNQQLFVSGAHDTDVLVSMFDRAMFGETDLDDDQTALH